MNENGTTYTIADGLALGLDESARKLEDLAGLARIFGERTFIRAYYTVHARSNEDVDKAAAAWGTKAAYVAPGHYRAVLAGGSVEVAAVCIGRGRQADAPEQESPVAA